jgi:hypothetical protein
VANFDAEVRPDFLKVSGEAGAKGVKILFLHGWQSVPGGVKPTFLARHGHRHTVVNPK